MKVYVATSWKNPSYVVVCAALRAKDFHVIDWASAPEALREFRRLDRDYRNACATRDDCLCRPDLACEMLAEERSAAAYKAERDMLLDAEALVLLTPCGRDAHFKAGFAVAMGTPAAVLMTPGVEPELMTAGMKACADLDALLAWLEVERRRMEFLRVGERVGGLCIGEPQIKTACDGCFVTLSVDGRNTWPSTEEALAAAHGAGWTGDASRCLCNECSANAPRNAD